MAENDNKEKEKAAAAKPLEDDPKEKETATAAAKPLEEKDDDPSEEPPPKKINKLRVKGDDDTRASGNIFDDKGRIIRTLNCCCCVDRVFELDLSDRKGSSKMQTECS